MSIMICFQTKYYNKGTIAYLFRLEINAFLLPKPLERLHIFYALKREYLFHNVPQSAKRWMYLLTQRK